MKTFILCGGFGTRLDYEGTLMAKPMVRIGKEPILMHIIQNYIHQGITEFVFCLGFKSNTIINYFLKENIKSVKIACGCYHTLLICEDGHLYTFGRGNHG